MRRDDDLLKQATQALRDSSTPSEQELADGRAVLLWAQRAAAKQKGPRGRTLRWVLPLAAVLTAGSALAATTAQLEWVGLAVDRCVEAVQTASAPRATSPRVAPKPLVTASPASMPADAADVADAGSVAVPAPPEPRTTSAVATRDTKSNAASRAKSGPSGRPVKVAPAPASLPPPVLESEAPAPRRSSDLAAYREAHRLHFGRRDFATALTAWDAYLASFPHGTFALEALYNRAICLLRLGRNDEARRALAPFAAGVMQNRYRQSEATELLEALE